MFVLHLYDVSAPPPSAQAGMASSVVLRKWQILSFLQPYTGGYRNIQLSKLHIQRLLGDHNVWRRHYMLLGD